MCSLFAMFLAMLFLVWSQNIKSLLRHSLTFTKIPVKILYLAYIQYHLNIHKIMSLELLKENKNLDIKFDLVMNIKKLHYFSGHHNFYDKDFEPCKILVSTEKKQSRTTYEISFIFHAFNFHLFNFFKTFLNFMLLTFFSY